MKKLLIGVGVVIVLFIVAVFVVPALIPADTYKSEIVSRVEAATGRKASIDGPVKLSVVPVLGFTAEKVSLANAPGASPPQMMTLDRLDMRIAAFPLLRGQLVVDSFVLEKPVIALSVDKAGTPNWQFAAKSTVQAGRAPAEGAPRSAAPPAAAPAGGSSRLSGLSLNNVRLSDGQATYTDARTGANYKVDAINMTVSLPSMTSPMKADGSFVWNQEKISLTANVANPNALLNGKQSAVDAKISGNPLSLTFNGQASNDKAFAAQGKIDLDVPSVRKLAAWGGRPLSMPGSGFGPLKIGGTANVSGGKASFTNATVALDQIKGTGDVRYDGTGPRPYVNARLATGVLDANPYLPPQAGGAGAGGAPAAPAKGTPAASGASHQWSDAPIDVAPLRSADADLDLGVDGLIYRKIKIGKSHVAVKLKDGKLAANLTDMALYQGHGKAQVTADASQSVPAIGLTFDLAGFQANPFLTDAMDMTRLEGTANADINVTGHGASQRAIVSSLNGAGKMQFLNGAIRGIDIPGMIRNAESAFTGAKSGQAQKTDFSQLGGTFTVRNGILTNNDMEMESPLLRVGGKGTVDLPKQTVDYRIEPKVVASLKGEGGKTNLGGVTVPIIVQGPWDNLSYKPDLAGMAKNPQNLNELKKMIPGQGTSPSAQDPGTAQAPSPPNNPAGTLKKLFGK